MPLSEVEYIGTVVLALTAIGTLFFMVTKPMATYVKAMTENTTAIKTLGKQIENLEVHNKESHQRLWNKSDCQDRMLNDHERRLHEIDKKWFEDKEEN